MRTKEPISARIFSLFNVLLFGLFALICFFPFYYIFINTISANDLVTRGAIMFYPKGIHWANYKQVFQLDALFGATMMSLARTVLGTVVSVLGTSFLAYAMTRPEYWKRNFWYRLLVITMYFNAGVIPMYINMKNLGLLNSFWVYILPGIVSPFNLILVKTYIESIPPSLEESAVMDGAGYFTRFRSIVLPLAGPIIATVAIFSAVGHWNSFMDTVLYMTGNRYETLQSLLYKYLNEINTLASLMRQNPSFAGVAMHQQLTPVSIRFTITIITVLPILLVYPFFQRYFVSGIMIGAVKG